MGTMTRAKAKKEALGPHTPGITSGSSPRQKGYEYSDSDEGDVDVEDHSPGSYQTTPHLKRKNPANLESFIAAKPDSDLQRMIKGKGSAVHASYEPETARTTNTCSHLENKPATSWPFYFLFVLIPVLVAIIWWYATYSPENPQPDVTDFTRVMEKFQGKSSTLKSKFPSQSDMSWRKIKTAVRATTAILQPQTPGIIALVALKDAENIAVCMGRVLAANLRDAYNDSEYVILKGTTFKGMKPSSVKEEMDNRIRRGLQNGKHVVLVEGMHYLPAESGLLFHGLCDNDNAPFKQAIYIFTSITDKLDPDERNQEVTTFWKNSMDEDKRSSLETRIGNNIIIVKPEDKSITRQCG